MKYFCRCVDDPGYAHEHDASEPGEAAEMFAEYCFDNWAWEGASNNYPMLVKVDGEGVFEVELEARPEFTAYRKSSVSGQSRSGGEG